MSPLEMADASVFARRLGFAPDEVQARVLDRCIHRGILNCCRQWGKSTVNALKALHRAHSEPGCLVIVASPSGRQSGEFLRKALPFVRAMGIKPRGDGDNDISLLLPNGSRIVGLPGREATVRGFSNPSLLLIDEASRVTDAMYDALRPMLATGNGDLWLMSTPFGRRGFFWEEWERGGDRWTRISVTGPECKRISTEFLDEQREKGERYFSQEYLCQFVSSDDALFDEKDVDGCISDDIPTLWED